LTNGENQRRINVCLELRGKVNEDPNFTRISRIITDDESWIYGYGPEKKAAIVAVEEPTITKSKKGAAGFEFNREHTHCFFFFDVKRIVHREFVPPKTVVNSDFYYDVLRSLRENVQRKTGTLAQPQPASSSRQCFRLLVPENHRVCD
jgi:hypothetical protein